MVEFNLLPEVKLQYLRAKKQEHLVLSISIFAGAVSLAIFIFLLVFTGVIQRSTINNLSSQINQSTATLSSNKNLNKILTVQNQLKTLPSLEAQTPVVSRLFNYISQITPPNATISTLSVDFTTDNISVSGGADSLATVNTYIDTLKYATYNNQTNNTKNNQAFNSIDLSSFGYSSASSGASPAQYSITFNFSPTLFSSTDKVTLVIPNEITTRSIINQPKLFKAEPTLTSKKTG